MILMCVLATYAVTLMLTSADGPYGIFARLQGQLGVLQCFLCTSVWVGALVALYLADSPIYWLILTLGLSGGATVIDYLTLRG